VSGLAWPARYEIRVDGVLEVRWADWFGGLRVENNGSQTVIVGVLADQPALHGSWPRSATSDSACSRCTGSTRLTPWGAGGRSTGSAGFRDPAAGSVTGNPAAAGGVASCTISVPNA
jgi:hypothetical protein